MPHTIKVITTIDEKITDKIFNHISLSDVFSYAFGLTKYSSLPLAAEVSVAITTDAEIRPYNKAYRGQDKATNVLSFPFYLKNELFKKPLYGDINLGDIIISWPIVIQEAEKYNTKPQERLIFLLIHGFLHLLHYDHHSAEEANAMEDLEKKIFAHINLPNPYGDDNESL